MTTVALALVSMLLVQEKKTGTEVMFSPTGERRLVQERISQEIGAARKEVVVAMYQFTSTQLAEALVKAHKRGVKVRLLVDGVQNAEQGRYANAIATCEEAGIDINRVFADGQKKKGNAAFRPRFHHKFCVIDGEKVLTGSYNWTVQGDTDNYESLLIISQKDIAQKYLAKFEEIWRDDSIVQKELP